MKTMPTLMRALAPLCLAVASAAAVIPRYSAERLLQAAEVIVEGRVIRIWSSWDANRKYIWTHYEINVFETLRGAAGASIVVSEPGGSIEGINQQIGGANAFSKQEHCVLFLYRTPIGYWRVAGGPQGRFTITLDARVRMESGDVGYIELPASAGTRLDAFQSSSLKDFKSHIRRLAASNPAMRTK
jgi:hypothetical protein